MLNVIFGEFWFDIQDTGTNRLCTIYYNDVSLDFEVKSWPTVNDYNNDTNRVDHVTGKDATSDDDPVLAFLIQRFKTPYYAPCIGTTLAEFYGQPSFPYANRQDTLNSPKCNLVICDLRIIQPIETIPSNATNDGSMTVQSVSSLGIVEFSLNNTDWFAADSVSSDTYTKTFSNLSAGLYDIFVRDAVGCTAQSEFEITTLGDYNTRYYLETVQNEKLLRINIKEKNYSGTEERLKWVSVKHVIGKPNDDLFKVIRGGVLQMSVIATESLDSLQSSDERLHLVEYLINDEERFSGFILPDLVQRPLGPEPYTVSFEATDQLGTLRNFDFLTRTGEEIEGRSSMLDVIRICLEFTDLPLDIVSGANIFESNEVLTDESDPLKLYYVDTDQYKGLNCYEVLERLLFNYKLFQLNEAWNIIPISQTDPYNVRTFDFEGNYQFTSEVDPQLELKRLGLQESKTSLLGNKEAFLTVREPVSEEVVIYDYGLDAQKIKNGEFDEWINNLEPKYWAGSAVQKSLTVKTAKANNTSDFTLKLNGEGTDSLTGEYMEAKTFEYSGGGLYSGEDYRLSLKVQLEGNLGVTDEARLPIRVEAVNDEGTFYLNDLNAVLGDDTQRIELSLYKQDLGKFIEAETRLNIPTTTGEGQITVRIQQPYMYSGAGNVDSITFEYALINFFLDESTPDANKEISLINPRANVSFKPEQRTVYLGALPDFDNAGAVYNNGIYDSSGNVLREFKRPNVDESLDYAKIYADNVLNSAIKKTDKITCRLVDRRGGNLDYFNLPVKVYGENDEKVYIINSWNRQEDRMIVSAELIELIKGYTVFDSELPFRLLEDGENRLLEDGSYRLLESE